MKLTMKRLDGLENMIELALEEITSHTQLFTPTWEDFFATAPKGDFEWNSDEGGDWVPYGKMDDEESWVKQSYYVDLSRKDGVETIKFGYIDVEGEDHCTGEYTKDEYVKFPEAFRSDAITGNCLYVLLRMRLYEVYCVKTGLDPLDNVFQEYTKERKETWVVTFNDYIGNTKGLRVTDFMHGNKHFAPNEVPEHIRAYCSLKKDCGHWIMDKVTKEVLDISAKIHDITKFKTKPNKFKMDVHISSKAIENTPERIKEVSANNLEKEILDLVDSVKKVIKEGLVKKS